jgi:hypothetical protein
MNFEREFFNFTQSRKLVFSSVARLKNRTGFRALKKSEEINFNLFFKKRVFSLSRRFGRFRALQEAERNKFYLFFQKKGV